MEEPETISRRKRMIRQSGHGESLEAHSEHVSWLLQQETAGGKYKEPDLWACRAFPAFRLGKIHKMASAIAA
jgi:hypothetical protein